MKDTESKKKKVKWNRGESKETNERRKKRQRRKKVRRWRAKETRVEKGRERETERAGKEWSEWGGGVTRGKSPRAIFPHIIIREGLGVSMETTHHPLPVPPPTSYTLHPVYLYAGGRALAHVHVCACLCVYPLMEVVARPPCLCLYAYKRACVITTRTHTYAHSRIFRMRIRRYDSQKRPGTRTVREYAREPALMWGAEGRTEGGE